MKLTSRSLKIGDKIIRKAPNKDEDTSFMGEFSVIKQKSPTHTTVARYYYPTDTSPSIYILDHFTWNDNEWVRYK